MRPFQSVHLVRRDLGGFPVFLSPLSFSLCSFYLSSHHTRANGEDGAIWHYCWWVYPPYAAPDSLPRSPCCKPWRFFSRSSRTRTIKASSPPIGDDIERPLVSDDLRLPQYHQRNDFDGNYTLLGGNQATDNHVSSLHSDKVSKQVASATSQLSQSGSFILDVISESSDDGINATLRRPLVANRLAEEQNRVKKEGQIPESNYREMLALRNLDPEDL
ncbi:uncharacterized protein LOC124938729 [Impatiens glandulifera]|uniref:uncharacterized protein LOC124938729 n=1 Tax=Impatiens glandulifera TaxID=253017 RepID=UPI001FB06BF4|nr:uncharacterized protein LOC124938729 [Impatiens glandulifera]